MKRFKHEARSKRKNVQQTTPEIQLRDGRPDESQDIGHLLVVAYTEYKKSMPPDRWDWYTNDMMMVRQRMEDSEVIVAEIDGKIAGTVTLYPPNGNHGWPTGWAGVRLLAVHPDFRGRNIGRLLMDECIRRCRERGIKTVGLHTTEEMKIARGMYERMGFRRVAEYDFHPEPERTIYGYSLNLE